MPKKFIKSILSSLLALILIISCCAIPSSAAVALNKSSVTLTKGYATKLSVSGTSSTPKWSTGDKSVATVSKTGQVIGKGVGTTYIYADINSTTLRCSVTVVAGKITAGIEELELRAGKTAKVRIMCKGTHTISLSNSNKRVAYGTWSGAKFDGDIVKLTIKAVSTGTARIKIYAKNYPDIYDYIDITVTNGTTTTTTDTTKKQQIMAQTSAVTVNKDESVSVNILSTTNEALQVASGSASIASATITNPSATGNYYTSTLAIKGLSSGNATIRVSSRSNTRVYTDISVKVDGGQYYAITTTIPNKNALTDQTLSFTANSKTYYMIVPSNYDSAYTNSLFAAYTNTYNYYYIYSIYPKTINYTDYIMPITSQVGGRYIILPLDYDDGAYNTAVAAYTKSYDYYAIYNVVPTKKTSSDVILDWSIVKSNASVKRYLLVPAGYDSTKTDKIIADDKAINNKYTLYTVLNESPTTVSNDEQIIVVYVNNVLKYMVVPKTVTLVEIAKKNAAISAASSNKIFYYTWYTTAPTNINDATEGVYSVQFQNVTYYLVYKTADTAETYNANVALANAGNQFFEARP